MKLFSITFNEIQEHSRILKNKKSKSKTFGNLYSVTNTELNIVIINNVYVISIIVERPNTCAIPTLWQGCFEVELVVLLHTMYDRMTYSLKCLHYGLHK